MNDPSGMAPEGGGNKDGSPFGKDSTTGETFLKRELDGVTISATRLLKNAVTVASTPMQSAQFGWDKDGKAKAGYTIPATDNLGSILEPGYQIRGRKPGASNVNPYHAGIAINMTKNPYALAFVLVGALAYHELTKNPGQETVFTIPRPGRTGEGVQASDGETQPASTTRPQAETRPQVEPNPPGVPVAIGRPKPPENKDEVITFYRGERDYVADDVVATQMWDLDEIAERQLYKPYDKGLYLTTQISTAHYFGGVFRFPEGYGILEMQVKKSDWASFLSINPDVVYERPMNRPPLPMMTETIIPFEKVATFRGILLQPGIKKCFSQYPQ